MNPRRSLIILLLALIPALVSQTMYAQAVIHQIMNNGPSDKRINIVFLSEGYTDIQLTNYITDASNNLEAFLKTVPFSNYRSYFNASAISVASKDSGSDHPSRKIIRDTFFNSTYDVNGIARLIAIDSIGQVRKDSLLQLLTPDYDIAIIIVNDPEYGGAGGSYTVASVNSTSAEIVIHELGHTMAGLGDEYTSPYPGFPDYEEPNTTRETRRDSIKWHSWILNATILPTPPTIQYGNVVGLFEGAHYQATGWFRPMLNCKMRGLGVPFCDVCSEALIKSLYRYIRPIESYYPADLNIPVADSQVVHLSVQPMLPTSHPLSIQWFVDGIQQNSATMRSFDISTTSLNKGVHLIHVIVCDTTMLVRYDQKAVLRDSTSWTITNSSHLSVDGKIFGPIPKQYSLEQNYPNPANPSTTISYAIPQPGMVSLKVYDILSREVATLVNDYKTQGQYTVSFDAGRLSSGMYIYRIQAGTYSAVKKMQVVK